MPARKKIMLVDDNRPTLTMGSGILSRTYETFPIPSAVTMFQILGKITPDLILLDVDMPEMDGYTAIEKLKSDARYSLIPVVFLTASDDSASELKGLSLGAVDYIRKPFTAPLLLKRIENLMIAEDAKAELVKEKEKALMASEAKSSFLSAMSHEIRTPMNAIIGMSELMRTDNFDSEQLRHLDNIKKMSHSLLEIINDILDFSKIEAAKLELLPTNFFIYQFFEHICDVMSFTSYKKDLEFKHSIEDSLPEVIFGDELRIRQIVVNIVSNAMKYTNKGYVELWIGRRKGEEGDFLAVKVKDTGIGIKAENLDKIFGAFEQVDREKNRQVTGTGLGLSITKRLVAMMGGHIEVASVYGEGSLFTVELPLVEGDSSLVENAALSSSPASVRPETNILVVDDNELNLEVATGFLKPYGANVDTADSGELAVSMVKVKRYDLVFMDHMMPGMSGIDAVKEIRALGGDYGNLSIVALSANAVSGAKEMFLGAGMNDFLSKPFNALELKAVLTKWLPKECVLEENPKAQSASNVEIEELSRGLSHVNNLDVSAGLTRVEGNVGFYVNLLKRFRKGAEGEIAALRGYFDGGDWENYRIKAHMFKSVFANLGNHFLSDRAAGLEALANENRHEEIKIIAPAFAAELEEFYEALKNTDILKEEAVEKTPIGKDELLSLLEALKEVIIVCNSEEAAKIEDGLRRASYNREADAALSELCDSLASFDYEKAQELLEKICDDVAK